MTIKKVKVKVNADIGGKNKGDEFLLDFIDEVPVSQFWLRRFRDSKIDKCIELVIIKGK